MNLFSSSLISLLLLLTSFSAWAMNLEAVYSDFCQRHVGIILGADKKWITMIDTQGGLKKIPRYSIQRIVFYPYDSFPFAGKIPLTKDIDVYSIFFIDPKTKDLIPHSKGILLSKTNNGVQLLSLGGEDILVPLESMAQIEKSEILNTLTFRFV